MFGEAHIIGSRWYFDGQWLRAREQCRWPVCTSLTRPQVPGTEG